MHLKRHRIIVALCADDGMVASDVYRPHTAAGAYVPTLLPAVPHWGRRRPWVMASGSQFRPGAPPSLTSDTWTRDYNEIKAIGAKNSTQRTPEQTAIARFWESDGPGRLLARGAIGGDGARPRR